VIELGANRYGKAAIRLVRVARAAKERRDLVLELMAKNGYATQAEADSAKAKPIQSTLF
jgi:membrane peptidoglycan carboxypeptidase